MESRKVNGTGCKGVKLNETKRRSASLVELQPVAPSHFFSCEFLLFTYTQDPQVNWGRLGRQWSNSAVSERGMRGEGKH
ncbi:unnamed protein product [Prunus armeniaca]